MWHCMGLRLFLYMCMEWDVSYLTGPEFFLLIVILVSCRGQFFLFSSVGSSFFYIGDVDVVAVCLRFCHHRVSRQLSIQVRCSSMLSCGWCSWRHEQMIVLSIQIICCRLWHFWHIYFDFKRKHLLKFSLWLPSSLLDFDTNMKHFVSSHWVYSSDDPFFLVYS